MALTVVSTAGVLVAPKAAAQTTAYLPLKYVAGKTYTYGPLKFNDHDTGYLGPLDAFRVERSSKGTVATLLRQTASQTGENYAIVGMLWRLTDFTADDLVKPCTATMQVTYTLAAKGDHGTGAEFYPDAYGLPDSRDFVFGDDSPPVKIVTQTLTYTGTVGEFFGGYGNTGVFLVEVSCWHNPTVDGTAAATATISSITVSFPTT